MAILTLYFPIVDVNTGVPPFGIRATLVDIYVKRWFEHAEIHLLVEKFSRTVMRFKTKYKQVQPMEWVTLKSAIFYPT